MIDVQNRPDDRNIPIDQVGVTDLLYPIAVPDPRSGSQKTVARVSMMVNLTHNFRGTHMSRFIEMLNAYRDQVTLQTTVDMAHELQRRLQATSARVELDFPYFIEKYAPVSRAPGLMEYRCAFVGASSPEGDDAVLRVTAPVTTLCPCSKEMSRYGAHNQRGSVSVEVRTVSGTRIDIEELVEVAENSASAPVYALLKREDEKILTEHAYENPVFVEDLVRNLAQRLMTDSRIDWFRVEALSLESIHNHNAFARIEWRRQADGHGAGSLKENEKER